MAQLGSPPPHPVPDASVHGLPRGLANAHYTDRAVLERESRAVLAGSWASIGFAGDVPAPGDALPVDFLGQPLLLLRGEDGAVRVFENVCRHRGMVLVDSPRRLKGVLQCPYHAWCYGFDGSLRTTPHVGGPGRHEHPDVDKARLGLYPVRTAVWLDVVFVNLSGTAPDFADFVAGIAARWREVAGRPLFHGGVDSTFELVAGCNWKLAVENYCESYHLPSVHPGLNLYSRLEDHYEIVDAAGAFSGQGTCVYAPSLDAGGRRFETIAGLSQAWDTQAEYVALYPNTLLGVHKDHVFAISLQPDGPARTRERVALYYASAAMTGDDWSDLRRRNAAMWRAVFAEDVGVVEGMQRGRSAPAFDGGALSPVMDRPTRVFHEWVAARYAAGS